MKIQSKFCSKKAKKEWAAICNSWWAKEGRKNNGIMVGRWFDDLILKNIVDHENSIV